MNILDYFYPKGLRKIYLPFDELYQRLLGSEKCQGVVIHEMRFTYQADGLVLIRDLGENWEAKTGFPIPLGAVALRPCEIRPVSAAARRRFFSTSPQRSSTRLIELSLGASPQLRL